MPTINYSLNLGAARSGLTDLRASLLTSTGSVQSTVTTGFIALGNGNYSVQIAVQPTTAAILFYSAADPTHPFGVLSVNGDVNGPNTVSLSFVDQSGVAVPNVKFVVPGQGSGQAGGSGVATIALPNGTYLVAGSQAIVTGLNPVTVVTFPSTILTVNGDTSLTIHGSATVILLAAPGHCAGIIEASQGAIVAYRLLTADGSDGYVRPRSWQDSPAADSNGIIQIDLIQGFSYQFRFNDGPVTPFIAPSASSALIPEVLGPARPVTTDSLP